MRTTLFSLFLFLAVIMTVQPITATESSTDTQASTILAEAADLPDAVISEVIAENPVLMEQWLHMLDAGKDESGDHTNVLSYAPQVPEDLARIMKSTGDGTQGAGFLNVLLRSLIAIGIGWIVVKGLLLIFRKRVTQFAYNVPPETDGLSLLWAKLLQNLPHFIALLFFAIAATVLFLIMAGSIGIKGRMLFQALLGTILIFRFCALFGKIIFSPDDKNFRPFKLDESLVKPLYRTFYISVGVLLSGLLIVRLFVELGAAQHSVSWVVIILGSAVIILYAILVYSLKQPVADALIKQLDEKDGGWLKRQMSTYWYGFALLYLLLVWFFWIGQQLTGTGGQKGTFIASMVIIPLFFALSYCGKLLIISSVEALNLGHIPDETFPDGTDEAVKTAERADKRRHIGNKAYATFKIVLTLILLTWFLSLWGFQIPYATEAFQAVFESLVILTLALVGWRATDRYITRMLEEAEPEPEEKEEDVDDEFGGAVTRGRSQTLLPMLRKFIGTVLVIMVLLVTLSAFGINIAPLLAGAGVIGLAIGFGAQKLVSDVLSGFFFLLDDAFRVGEYIQAGSIRGTVEAITLRNVMLRHHLGMLQVVPHSDLGAITNYMRGGIVIKFPLEFPYDTDIDKVRKIIKKVGIAMLADEELGDDFILPLKSQGVHQIANSVMVIRVKFTAKPGKQFVIKREAFRRLTEALNAKGIHYAHRKVLVDFPEEAKLDTHSPEAQLKALEAGAAAALTIEAEQQQQQKDKES